MNWLEVIARRKLEPLKVETVHILSPVNFKISLCYCIISCIIYHLGRGRITWTDCKGDARRFVRKNIAKGAALNVSCSKPRILVADKKEHYSTFRKIWFYACHLNGVKYRHQDAGMKWREILNLEFKRRISNLDEKIDVYKSLRDAEMLFMTQEKVNEMYNRLEGGCGLYGVSGNLLQRNL